MMSLQPTHHGMMTMSYSDGCPQSLPAFSGRYNKATTTKTKAKGFKSGAADGVKLTK
jgi:hypothetical protein